MEECPVGTVPPIMTPLTRFSAVSGSMAVMTKVDITLKTPVFIVAEGAVAT